MIKERKGGREYVYVFPQKTTRRLLPEAGETNVGRQNFPGQTELGAETERYLSSVTSASAEGTKEEVGTLP